jgi:hypothetical protein
VSAATLSPAGNSASATEVRTDADGSGVAATAALARGDQLFDTRHAATEALGRAGEREHDAPAHVHSRVVVVTLIMRADAISHEDDLGVDVTVRRAAMRRPFLADDRRRTARKVI